VRMSFDEPARHATARLLGALSLLAQDGGQGLPLGHAVTHNARPELLLRLVAALHEVIDPQADAVSYPAALTAQARAEAQAAARRGRPISSNTGGSSIAAAAAAGSSAQLAATTVVGGGMKAAAEEWGDDDEEEEDEEEGEE
jgi:hypothetical protein